MTNPNFAEDDEKPLDAAQLRLQAKLKKLLLGSTLVMVLGFVAVFAAIFYRVTRSEVKPAASEHPIVAELPLPEGAHVAATRLDGDRLTITMESPKGATILILDVATMKAIRRLELTAGK
ncbi:MAG: DUF6476 family protein [Hyphomicrobiales bacterium]|nr:DUF6476 family protein [Hyphomicrobiales bacterium]